MTETLSVSPLIAVADDDQDVRESIARLLKSVRLVSHTFATGKELEEAIKTHEFGCLILDVRMPVTSGMDLYERLKKNGFATPTLFITGYADVPMAIRAIKLGGLDLIQKPFNDQLLIDRVNDCLTAWDRYSAIRANVKKTTDAVATLTPREREVMDLVVSGMSNKDIAVKLGIARKTLDIHRSKVITKTGARSLADLTSRVTECRHFLQKGTP